MDYPSDDILVARGKISTLNRKRRKLMKDLQSYCQRAQSANLSILSFANDSKIEEGIPKAEELMLCATAIPNIQTELVQVLSEISELNIQAWGTI